MRPASVYLAALALALATAPAKAERPVSKVTPARAHEHELVARPTGLVAVLPYDAKMTLDLAALDNPSISGVAVQIHWADLEPTAGGYNWTPLDQLFKKAHETKKWVQLLVFPGFFAPAWAYPAPDSADFPIQYGPGAGTVMPLAAPWDATYQKNWLAFVGALAGRYAKERELAIVAVAGPTSVSVETTEPDTPADVRSWQKLGYTQTKYLDAWNQDLAAFATDFPSQYLSLSGQKNESSIVGIDETGKIVNRPLGTKGMIVDSALTLFGARLGLQNSNLDGSAGGDRPNTDYIVSYTGQVLTGFQLRSPVSGPGMGPGTPEQNLKASFASAMRPGPTGAHVDYIEIYDRDVENPALQKTLAYGASLFPPPRR